MTMEYEKLPEYKMLREDAISLYLQTYGMALGSIVKSMTTEEFRLHYEAFEKRIKTHCERFLSDSLTPDGKRKVTLSVLEDCVAIVKGELVL